MDLSVVLPWVNELGKWLQNLLTADAKEHARWRRAIVPLQEAVIQTGFYVSALERGAPTDLEKQRGLARLWQRAASAFYGVDGNTADRLQLKAEYWTNPDAWTNQQIIDAGISLQRVAEYTRQLLREG